jgi:hypothetical protein
MKPILLFCSLLIALKTFAFAQNIEDEKKKDSWIISGQIQIRPELDGRDFSNKTYPPLFTSMRTRLALEKLILNDLTLFVQVQDSRMWGQEKGTTNSLSNVDLHQAWAKINNIFGQLLSVQVGRFEMSYGTQRFIGSNQWNYISRSFDGLRLGYKTDPFWIDIFNCTIINNTNYINGMLPNQSQYPAIADTAFNYLGFWSNLKVMSGQNIDLFSYWEYDQRKDEFERRRTDTTFSGNRQIETNRYTAGLNYSLTQGNFSAVLEAAYQCGVLSSASKSNKKDSAITYSDLNVSAYTVAIRLQYDFEPCSISLNAELHSGTKHADTLKQLTKFNTFDNTYSTKHQLYGYMGYFTDISKSTLNLGLNDFYLRVKYKVKESPFDAQLDIHYFLLNQPTFSIIENKEVSDLGAEIDLVLKYSILKNSSLEYGISTFLPGTAMKTIYDMNKKDQIFDHQDIGFWSYIMLRINI